MSEPKEGTGAIIDQAFDDFVFGGFTEDERARIRGRAADLNQQIVDAIDTLKGLMADREGKAALARALREGVKGG